MDDQVSWRRRWLRADVALTVVALAAGGAGAVLAGKYLSQRAAADRARLEQRYAGQDIVVASADLPRGAVLTAGNLAVRSVPRDFVPADAVPAAGAGQLLGATLAIDMARGTPVVTGALAPAGAPLSRLSDALAPDERALTVAVDELDSQAGGLRSGDRIDLYYSQRASGGARLVPLLQQVEILGVGDSFMADRDGAPRNFATVTLRVSSSDAPRLLLAQQAGDLSVLLRSPHDTAALPVAIRNSSELLRVPSTGRSTASQIELLVGGGGQQVPERRLLTVTARRIAEAT